jgi:ankyrin repeat protein
MADINEELIANIKQNNINEVIKLLNAGADINYAFGSPLYYAVASNNYSIVKLLSEKDGNINSNKGYLLRRACKSGYSEIIELLLNEGINYTKNKNSSLIAWCIYNDDIDSLRLLIQYNIEKLTIEQHIRFDFDYDGGSIWDICLKYKAKNILEFIINHYPKIIPKDFDKLSIKQKDIQKYNFIKMLINKNLIDVPD